MTACCPDTETCHHTGGEYANPGHWYAMAFDHHLGHVLLYLGSSTARNECQDALEEWHSARNGRGRGVMNAYRRADLERVPPASVFISSIDIRIAVQDIGIHL
jgi:hypothetical protein